MNIKKEDIISVLDYCQSDEEWKSFKQYLLDNLDDNDLDQFIRVCKLNDYEEIQKMMDGFSKTYNNHIWAVSNRVRMSLNEI